MTPMYLIQIEVFIQELLHYSTYIRHYVSVIIECVRHDMTFKINIFIHIIYDYDC